MNGFTSEVDGNTFGIIISLYAINWLIGKGDEENLIRKYHLLRDFAFQKSNSDLIYGVID